MKVQFAIFIISFQATRFVLLYINDKSLTEFQQIINFNMVKLLELPNFFALFAACYILFGAKVGHIFYFQNNGIVYKLIKDIILYENNSFFLSSYYYFRYFTFLNGNKISKSATIIAFAVGNLIQCSINSASMLLFYINCLKN